MVGSNVMFWQHPFTYQLKRHHEILFDVTSAVLRRVPLYSLLLLLLPLLSLLFPNFSSTQNRGRTIRKYPAERYCFIFSKSAYCIVYHSLFKTELTKFCMPTFSLSITNPDNNGRPDQHSRRTRPLAVSLTSWRPGSLVYFRR